MPAKAPKQPQNRIILQAGRVVLVEEWTLWSGVPDITIQLIRGEDGTLRHYIGDPEHGGSVGKGQLEDLTTWFHPDVAAAFQRLFALEDADPEAVRRAGFGDYKIEAWSKPAA